MIRKNCRLERASKYFLGGGGGGSTDINQMPGGFRSWRTEQPDIKKGYDFNIGEYNNFVANNPLLNAAQGGALDFWKQLPGMLAQFPGFQQELTDDQGQLKGYQGQLQGLFGQIPGLQQQAQSEFGGFLGQIPGLQDALGGMIPGIQKQFGGLDSQLGNLYKQTGFLGQNYDKFLGPGSALSAAYGGASGIGATLRSHGALSQEAKNAALQQGRISGEQAGTTRDPSSIIADYTSRKSATDANFNQALAQSQNVLGQQSGAVQGMQGLFGQQANIAGQRGQLDALGSQLQSGILGQQAGLLGLGGSLASQNAGIQQGLLGMGGQLAGQGAGLTQLLAGLTGQKAGLLGQQQALQTGGLNQLLGVGNAAVSQFGGLTNPILSYIQGIFGGNQQAAIQQAAINAQQNASSGAETGGIISSIGSIIGGIAMAY